MDNRAHNPTPISGPSQTPRRRASDPLSMWVRGLAACAMALGLAACATTPPPSQALSSSAYLRPTSDKTRPYAYRRPDANFASYSRVIVPPTAIYAGPDAQFGKMSVTDQQALASYMHQEVSKVLGRRFQLVG